MEVKSFGTNTLYLESYLLHLIACCCCYLSSVNCYCYRQPTSYNGLKVFVSNRAWYLGSFKATSYVIFLSEFLFSLYVKCMEVSRIHTVFHSVLTLSVERKHVNYSIAGRLSDRKDMRSRSVLCLLWFVFWKSSSILVSLRQYARGVGPKLFCRLWSYARKLSFWLVTREWYGLRELTFFALGNGFYDFLYLCKCFHALRRHRFRVALSNYTD